MDDLSFQMQETLEVISMMRDRELRYIPRHYVSALHSHERGEEVDDSLIDGKCRQVLVEWCYRVVDHYAIPRHVVATAMNFVDRFCSRHKCDRDALKLVTTTSLFLSLKLFQGNYECRSGFEVDYEQGGYSLNVSKVLPSLTNGQYSAGHISRFETVLIQSLGFFVNPPLPARYLDEYLNLLPLSGLKSFVDTPTCFSGSIFRQRLMAKSQFFTELAVVESSLLSALPSLVGLACVLNALRLTQQQHLINKDKQRNKSCIITALPSEKPKSDHIIDEFEISSNFLQSIILSQNSSSKSDIQPNCMFTSCTQEQDQLYHLRRIQDILWDAYEDHTHTETTQSMKHQEAQIRNSPTSVVADGSFL